MKKQVQMKTLTGIIFTFFAFLSFAQHDDQDSLMASNDIARESGVNIYAPNAFTPDGDFYNDNWQVHANGIDVYNFHLMIFDRTGQLIWESYDPSAAWDGTYGGSPVPAGMYVWMINAKEIASDKRHKFDGFINVLR